MVENCLPSAEVCFQGKDANEEFSFCFHQHWIRMLWPLTKVIIQSTLIISAGYIVIVMIGINDAHSRHLLLLMLTTLFLLSHIEFLSRFYKYFLYVIVVTDKKVHRIKKTLVAINDHQSIDLWMLQDINKCQHGIIQNIFQFGTLILEAQDTILRIHFVPKISKKYEMLTKLRERARSAVSHSARASGNRYLEAPHPEPLPSPSRKEALYWEHADTVQ